MTTSLPLIDRRRLRRLAAGLWSCLLLIVGLSWAMARQQGPGVAEADDLGRSSARLLHEMAVVVEEARGLSALHLLRTDSADRQDVEARLQRVRQQLERRMAATMARPADDTERGLHRRVQASLLAFWSAQDRLLAASRQAASQPDAAARARWLLGGESQQAYHQLRADLTAWQAYTDERAAQAAARAAAQARWQQGLLALQLPLLAGLGVAVALAWRAASAPRPAAVDPDGGRPAASPAGQDQLQAHLQTRLQARLQAQLQPHLQALDAAVQAARQGVGEPPGAVQRQDLRTLAVQLADTARRLQEALAAGTAPPGSPDRH